MPQQANHYIIRMRPPAPVDRDSFIDKVLADNGYIRGRATVDFKVVNVFLALSEAHMMFLVHQYIDIDKVFKIDKVMRHKFNGGTRGWLIAIFYK